VEDRPSKLADALTTIPVVWLSLIVAGLSGGWLQPSIAGALVSVVVCIGLLFAWGNWTGPGRRTTLPIFLLAGLLYLALAMALLLSAHPELYTEATTWLCAGLTVGFMPSGGADTPLEYYIFPMLLNLFGPIVVMGTLRAWMRGDFRT
jgi:hypothetical protein